MGSTSDDVAAQLRNFLRILREQAWLVLLCVAVTTGAAVYYANEQDDEYETQAQVLSQQENLSAALVGSLPTLGDSVRQAATDDRLAGLPVIGDRTAAKLGRHAKAVFGEIEGDSNVVVITVQDEDPEFAATFANAYALEFIAFRREANRSRYDQALKTLNGRLRALNRRQRRTPAGRRLADQAEQLRTVAGLQTGDAQIVQRAAVPGEPFRPNDERTIGLGLVFGLLLGLALAILRDRLDRRLKTADQVRAVLGDLPMLGSIPRPRRGKSGMAPTADGFHALEANVSAVPDGRPRTVLVTSAAPGEGKSTVAVNLALSTGQRGRAATVLEADLRRTEISRTLGLSGDAGVALVLTGGTPLDGKIVRLTVTPPRRHRRRRGLIVALEGTLDVVPAGRASASPHVLFEDERVESLLAQASALREAVVIDGPPLGVFADMLSVARKVDAVLIVVRLYHSRRDDLLRFMQQLDDSGIRPLGVVVLGADRDAPHYYRDY
jgi:Mrp family chromosome partitioning ATPase